MKTQKTDSQVKPLPDSTDHTKQRMTVVCVRAAIILAIAACVYYYETLQRWTNSLWYLLLQWNVFHSVYFESWFATFCYAVIMQVYPRVLNNMKSLDSYKIHPGVAYQKQTVLNILHNAVMYMAPLMLLDTLMVKKYDGVDPSIWMEKRKSMIQTTRALPVEPPSLSELVFDLIASVLLYDAIFFFIHYLLHKNFWLYKTFHAVHHDHGDMDAHVTHQLTLGERLSLVLSANFALNVFHSHPLTRSVFVPVFIFLLVDNHTGYDLPWGLHKIVPFGVMGGPRNHYIHHMEGGRHYQPFLHYLDKLFEMSRN